MTEDLRQIGRMKRVIEDAEKVGNIRTTCDCFEIARSTFDLWLDRYRELGEAAGLARRKCDFHKLPQASKRRGSSRRPRREDPLPGAGLRQVPDSERLVPAALFARLRYPTRPCTASARGTACPGSRIGSGVGPCIRIDIKSGFQARYGEVAVNFLTLKRKSGGRARPYQ